MSQILKDLADEGNFHSDAVNEALEKLAKELGEKYDTSNDKGTDALLTDLITLFGEAFHYEFHDFKNKKYPTPKVELRRQLLGLAENVVKGKYDN